MGTIQVIPEVIDSGGHRRIKLTVRDGERVVDADLVNPLNASSHTPPIHPSIGVFCVPRVPAESRLVDSFQEEGVTMYLYETNPESKPLDTELCQWKHRCVHCERRRAEIVMWLYAVDQREILLCPHCALQLSRKLLQDLCAVEGERKG
jgi:hypothetical protein